MMPETVDRILQEVTSEIGCLTRNQATILEEVRVYALGLDVDPALVASMAYRIGFHIVANSGHGPERLELGNKLLALINLRASASTGTTAADKEAARKLVYPTVWDLL